MKVTTDACIQGAWTPVQAGVSRVLDIGTGTGLLALMLAQRDPGITIDAIELDHEAAEQASENIAASPWSERINILEGDVCKFPFSHKYDLIITNPPFFNNSLLSGNAQKDVARHTLTLSYDDLLQVMDDNLTKDGYASILLPYPEYQEWSQIAGGKGWNEHGRLHVRHRQGAAVKRVVGLFSRDSVAINEQELVIQDGHGKYTPAFSQLLSPYYLDLLPH